MTRLTSSFLLLFLFAACDGTDIADFPIYGTGMPGNNLAEGGEALFEKLHISPGLTGAEAATVNQFHAFQYTGDFMGAMRGPNPNAVDGECFEFVHPISFPVHDIADTADYVDWGDSIRLSGPGLDVEVTKTIAPAEGLTDNRPSPVRTHKEGNWLYGGPAWQAANFQDFAIDDNADYELDLGGAEPLTFHFAPQYDFPLNAGTEDVTLPASGDLDLTWEAIPNPKGDVHTAEHTFTFVAFAQFPDTAAGDLGPTPLFLCTPPPGTDGAVTIPADILSQIPDAGIFQAGRLTHFMQALDDTGSACDAPYTGCRRFDMFTIWCAVSAYTKE